MPWKPDYKWSGDTETCATCPSLSLWFHLLPHVFGSLPFSAVDLLAISHTSQVHFRAFAFAAPSTFNVLFPNRHTAPSLTSYRSLLKRHQRDFPWAYVCLFFLILFIFLYSRFLLVINFIHISVYVSIPISQFITPPPTSPATLPPLVSKRLFSSCS